MPTLNIEGDDHHFIIRTKTYDHKFVSWRVTDGGIHFLKQKGISIPRVAGDKVTFDKPLLDKMRDRDLVYNNKGKQHPPEEDEGDLNAEQRLGLVFCEKKNHNGWEFVVAARKVPDAWRRQSTKTSWQNCKLHISDPNTFYNREQRLLGSWTLADILADKSCAMEPITGRYIVEAQGEWPSGCNIQKWIHDFSGMRVDGTFFHDTAHGGWRLASHEVIYPDRTYYLVAPAGMVIPKEVMSRLLMTLPAVSPYSSLEKWQAWSITIPHIYHELTYGRLQDWLERIGHLLRELPWRLALLSPPPVYYTSEGIPVLEEGHEAIIDVLPPADPIQGAESTEIQVKRDTVLCLPPTAEIRSHCSLTFPLHQPGNYLIDGVKGLTRPLNFKVIAKEQNYSFASPQALNITVKIIEKVYYLDAFENGLSTSREHILEVDNFDQMSLPQVNISSPIPLDLSWTFGKESESHWQSAEPNSLAAYIKDIFVAAWKKHETVSLCLDAGAFGKMTFKVVLRKAVIQRPVDKEHLANIEDTDRMQLSLQWLLDELVQQKGQGIQISIPSTIRKRLGRLESIPECTVLLQYDLVPLPLLPHLVAMTTILEREQRLSTQL